MRLVKGVRFCEFGLVVHQPGLLLFRKHGEELVILPLALGFKFLPWYAFGATGREIIVVSQVRQQKPFTQLPCLPV
jgi:hypothetical protein